MDEGRPRVGFELQVYPAGVLPRVHVIVPLKERWSIVLRGGWNLTDRRGWGEHDDESGDGPGGGFGLRRRLDAWGRSWSVTLRADSWWLDVDWEDEATAEELAATGSTEILVFQPTAQLGLLLWSTPRWTGEVTLALGQEINVDTEGEDVGEGPILLLGLTLLR